MAWAPREGEKRQKDFTRTNARARRMRGDQTLSERRLWKLLRQLNREGASFRRQAGMGPYVYDFGDYSASLLIELDGVVHDLIDAAALHDARKTQWANAQGFHLLRIRNGEVWSDPDGVLDRLRAALLERPPPLTPPHKGEGK